MPVSLLGTGFGAVTSVAVEGTAVAFTRTGTTRMDFTMPPGAPNLMADLTLNTSGAPVTARDVFTYSPPQTTTMSQQTGGVVTTTNNSMTVTVPSQGTSGTMSVSAAPVAPPTPTPLERLLVVCRVYATMNKVSVESVLVSLYFSVKANPNSISAEYRLALFKYIEGGAARGDALPGRWELVPGGTYDSTKGEFTVPIKDMGIYAAGLIRIREYYFPQVGPR
jgi:hypothetical protein